MKIADIDLIREAIIDWVYSSGRAMYRVGLQPLYCWDCRFECHQGHGCLSLVSGVCCQEEVSVTGRSHVQSSPAECGVSVIEEPRRRGLSPLGLSSQEKKIILRFLISLMAIIQTSPLHNFQE
jgi:hypothetical protein